MTGSSVALLQNFLGCKGTECCISLEDYVSGFLGDEPQVERDLTVKNGITIISN
jgi:hypothetical protein